jgi:UDP-N-acetylglucosamine enolpyruvyl transferase
MDKLRIVGGKPLAGVVTIDGAKKRGAAGFVCLLAYGLALSYC